MKHLPTVAGALLGLMFVAFSLMFLTGQVPEQEPPPEGSPPALFMGAVGPTGYMTFVKVLELAGGLLVLLPKTRNLGLLVLGPIIVNILAFHVFITNGKDLFNPILMVICVLALFLVWTERRAFGGLVTRGRS